MGGSLVQPENKLNESGSKSIPSEQPTNQPVSDQVRETPCSKSDPSLHVDFNAHCKKAETRASSSKMISQRQERTSSKVDLSMLRDNKDHCTKGEDREGSSHMISQQRERTSSKIDLTASRDGQDHGNERDNREFSQQKSDRQERHGSKVDLSVSRDNKDHCNRADNSREYSQQRERFGSKMDLCLSKDNKEHCSYGEDREFTPQKNDRRERHLSKLELPMSGEGKDHCNKAEIREFNKHMSDRGERHCAKGIPPASRDGKDLCNQEDNRASGQPINQRRERHCNKAELCPPRDFKELCNKKEYSRDCNQPMSNQGQERPCSKVDFSLPKECKDQYNMRENSPPMMNQRWERPGPKMDLPAPRESKDLCSKRENRECSQPNIIQRRESSCSKEDLSICQDFKEYSSKKENREFIPPMTSKIRAKPASRMDFPKSWDSTEQGLKSADRAPTNRVYADPFKSCEALPEQSKVKTSTSNVPPYSRGSFVKSQPLSIPAYESTFQNEIDKVRWESATVIQSSWRGYVVRRELFKQYDSATVIQAAWRGHSTRKKLADRDLAATVIQANYRGYQTRKDLDAQEQRAIQIRKDWEDFLNRQLAEKHECSIAEQIHYKDHKSRAEFLVKNHAAILIQSYFKGYRTRKAFQERKKAALRKPSDNQGQWIKKQPPAKPLFAAKSSSAYSLPKYSSGSRDSSPETASKSSVHRTVTPESSSTSTDQTSHSYRAPRYGNNAKKPQGNRQQTRANVLEAIGQGPVSSDYSPSDSTEESEPEEEVPQNPRVGRPEQTRPLYKYETVEKKTCPSARPAPAITQVCGRTLIPRMPLSIPFTCRRTVARGVSPELSQDRGLAEKDKRLPCRRDYVPVYSPDTFRRKLTRGYPPESSMNKLRERRKFLYESKLLQDKYLHSRPEQKPPLSAFSPPTCRRKMTRDCSPDPPTCREQERTAFKGPLEQDKSLPCKQESKPPVPPHCPDTGRRRPAHEHSPEKSQCRVREKPKPSYDGRHLPDKRLHCKKEPKPPASSHSLETYRRKVTCSNSADQPQDQGREMKGALYDSMREVQDKNRHGQAHKPSLPSCSAEGGRRKPASGKTLELPQDRARAQSSCDRRSDGRDQPPPSKAEAKPWKPDQQTSSTSLAGGLGSQRKCAKTTRWAQSGGGESKRDGEARKHLQEPSKRIQSAGVCYTGSKMRNEFGCCSDPLKEMPAKGLLPGKTQSSLVYPTYRGSRDPVHGTGQGLTNVTNNATKITDKYVFKSRQKYQQEKNAASTIQSSWKGLRTRLAIKHQHKAATQIQALYRGYKARQYLQAAGVLSKDDDEEKVEQKGPKAYGDGQLFSPPSRSSPKGDGGRRCVRDPNSWYQPGRQSVYSIREVVKEGDLSSRFSHRSLI